MPDFLMVLGRMTPIGGNDSIKTSSSQVGVPLNEKSGPAKKDSVTHHHRVIHPSLQSGVYVFRPYDPFLPRPVLGQIITVNHSSTNVKIAKEVTSASNQGTTQLVIPVSPWEPIAPVCVNPDELQGAYYFQPKWEMSQLFPNANSIPQFWNVTLEPIRGRVYKPAKKIETWQSDWTIGALLLVLILFASVRKFFGRYLNQLFSATVNKTTAMRLLREGTYNLSHGAYRLDLIFYLTFTFLIFLSIQCLRIVFPWSGFILYLLLLGVVLCYFVSKNLLYRMLGVITLTQSETHEYLFNAKVYNKVLGIILFPIIVAGSYLSLQPPVWVVTAGVVIALLFYLSSLIRGSLIMLRKHFSIFYWILYLCTLEVLPLFLIWKIMASQGK